MKKLIWILVMIFMSLPSITMAHEGHGIVEHGPGHYVFSIEHALPVLAVVAVAVYLVRKRIVKRRSTSK